MPDLCSHSFFSALGSVIVLGVVSLIAAGFGLIPGLRQRISAHDVKLPRWAGPVVFVLAFLAVMTLPMLLTTCR